MQTESWELVLFRESIVKNACFVNNRSLLKGLTIWLLKKHYQKNGIQLKMVN